MLAWPDVEAEADGRRGDPLRHRPQDQRGEGEGVRARVDGREVLEGDDHAETLGAGSRAPASERVSASRPILAGGLVRQVGGVVDDVRGVHLGGVGDQALEGLVAVARAGADRSGPVQDRLEAGGAGAPRRGPRRGGSHPAG